MELEEKVQKIKDNSESIDYIIPTIIRDRNKIDHKGISIELDAITMDNELLLTKEDLETLLELANTVEL